MDIARAFEWLDGVEGEASTRTGEQPDRYRDIERDQFAEIWFPADVDWTTFTSLNRIPASLPSVESQRIRLATQISQL